MTFPLGSEFGSQVYSVKTWHEGTRLMQSSGFEESLGSIRKGLVTKVIATEEAGIRETLIKMGWTPPGHVAASPFTREEAHMKLAEARDDAARLADAIHEARKNFCLSGAAMKRTAGCPRSDLEFITGVADWFRGRRF